VRHDGVTQQDIPFDADIDISSFNVSPDFAIEFLGTRTSTGTVGLTTGRSPSSPDKTVPARRRREARATRLKLVHGPHRPDAHDPSPRRSHRLGPH
jgi:hypothetical protein